MPPQPPNLLDRYTYFANFNKSLLDHLDILLEHLDQKGVRVLLLKGMDFLTRGSGPLGTRPSNDIDLLIREKDLPVIDAIADQLGYQPMRNGNPSYLSRDQSIALDLSTSIWYLDSIVPLWERAQMRPFRNRTAWVLGPEDSLVFLCAYTVIYRGYFLPPFIQDLRDLLREKDLNWNFVFEEAARHSLKPALYHALTYGLSIQPLNIPEAMIEKLRPRSRPEKFQTFLFKRLVTEKRIRGLGHFLLFVTRNRRGRWQELRKSFFPEETFIEYRYGRLTKNKRLRERLLRPVHMLIQAILLTGRILLRLFKIG